MSKNLLILQKKIKDIKFMLKKLNHLKFALNAKILIVKLKNYFLFVLIFFRYYHLISC